MIGPTQRRPRTNWVLTIVTVIASLSVLIPMYMTVVTALKDRRDTGSPWALPKKLVWSNFPEAWEKTHFPQALLNSVVITGSVIILVILSNSLVGYAIARNLHRRPFKVMFFYLLTALFVPFPILMLPLVKQMAALGLDNVIGAILLYVVYNMAFNTLLYTGYLNTIPVALDEAATIDGASTWRTFWLVIFPLLKPMHVTVAILTGLNVWNDFLLPLVILSDKAQYTLPLTQYAFQGQFTSNYHLAFASYLMSMAPMLILYLFTQRWIIGGVAQGAVKA